jgi:hypothetical protein
LLPVDFGLSQYGLNFLSLKWVFDLPTAIGSRPFFLHIFDLIFVGFLILEDVLGEVVQIAEWFPGVVFCSLVAFPLYEVLSSAFGDLDIEDAFDEVLSRFEGGFADASSGGLVVPFGRLFDHNICLSICKQRGDISDDYVYKNGKRPPKHLPSLLHLSFFLLLATYSLLAFITKSNISIVAFVRPVCFLYPSAKHAENLLGLC